MRLPVLLFAITTLMYQAQALEQIRGIQQGYKCTLGSRLSAKMLRGAKKNDQYPYEYRSKRGDLRVIADKDRLVFFVALIKKFPADVKPAKVVVHYEREVRKAIARHGAGVGTTSEPRDGAFYTIVQVTPFDRIKARREIQRIEKKKCRIGNKRRISAANRELLDTLEKRRVTLRGQVINLEGIRRTLQIIYHPERVEIRYRLEKVWKENTP